MRLVVHVDGGARGNPGPAAAGAVLSTPGGEVVGEAAEAIGVATNNVAEYRGLLLGLQKARELGASEVEVVNDSELVAKQVNGVYKVKHPDMKPLHAAALEALRGFDRWSIRSVPRAQNADADALVNQALDLLGPLPELLDTRGTIYWHLDRPRDGLADLRRAIDINSSPVRLFHLAQIQWKLLDREEAERALQEAVSAGLTETQLHPLERGHFRELQAELQKK